MLGLLREFVIAEKTSFTTFRVMESDSSGERNTFNSNKFEKNTSGTPLGLRSKISDNSWTRDDILKLTLLIHGRIC